MQTDIRILFSKTLEQAVEALLTIEPLAPLSMVSTMPGSFYKTLGEPSDFNIWGAIENVLGWHFDEDTRKAVRKKILSHSQKKKHDNPDIKTSEVGYLPLLSHIVEILPNPIQVNSPKMYYKDLWKQQRKRSDMYSHPNGTMNISYEIIPFKMDLDRDSKKGTVTNDAITKFYAEHKSRYPMYYTSAGNREFVVLLSGVYYYKLRMPEQLLLLLSEAIIENNMAYLGTNEGWVNLKIERL